ncbi:hypothetical protein [Clostridium sp. JS66]|uniref:hypothetical protein n=1 Tax=Clostridium sp. JS66 TaxID=3064705 RepID=UPI00298DE1EA|nr:hypothetical protein [Clostridium sp. JS66]WPC39381.1 hypothetical protein Q6H37_15810 [Clostridium sp. JS66]
MNIDNLNFTSTIDIENRKNDNYKEFLDAIKNHFNLIIKNNTSLFTTNSKGLFDIFLDNLPQEARQHYNCNSCKNFVESYGGLVTIANNGEIISALWGEVPEFFTPSVKAMKNIVLKSKVNGVFLSENAILGKPVTGIWNHMSVTLPEEITYHSKLINANQAMAEKLEDFKTLNRGLVEYPLEAVEQAVTLLKTESLYRSEKCLGVAEWLKNLHIKCSNTKNSCIKDNIVWLAVATAPTGFCHVKSSMIGTLLDDIVSGLDFDLISHRFAEKMHPLKYQRPQAAPSAGNIAQAEKIVEKLGIQKSLVRRFARLDELNTLWKPTNKEKQEKKLGLFSHIIPKNKEKHSKIDIPPITMTWKKFSETVLPYAESIEYLVKGGTDSFSAILTASYDDAPPVLQWDMEEQRNPFSWYVYVNGSLCSSWGLSTGYCRVTGICLQPSMWYDNFEYQGKAVFFILQGAKDNKFEDSGNCLFPSMLKSELHQVRSTIEAYSKTATIEGYNEASACGIRLQYGDNWNTTFRVTTNVGTATYKLDRWD